MTTKKHPSTLDAKALANTAKGMIESLLNNPKTRIEPTVKEWNICVEQSGFQCIFDFPVGEYKRKAWLIADLTRVIGQLNDYVVPSDKDPVVAKEELEQCFKTIHEETTKEIQKLERETVCNASGFRLSKKEKHNAPLHKLLCNGFRFALVNSENNVIHSARYEYQLEQVKPRYPKNFRIVEIKSLLVGE
ncbi:hypothetical protein CB599_11620 [Salmonella enterica subsp. enterica serovar Adjame]|nr:hypothetical protein [Salmonella enterica subsp. enterica serovar Adjame]